MKQIKSEEITAEPLPIGTETGSLSLYDGLESPFTEDVIILSQEHKNQVESFAISAANAFGNSSGDKEPTGAQSEHGVPALVVRVDCTINGGTVGGYEMEDSPSGQGITDAIHNKVALSGIKHKILEHYALHTGYIPHIIISEHRHHGTDDVMIVGSENYSFGLPNLELAKDGSPVIIKAIPGIEASHTPYLHLQDRTLAPLVTEGDKSYLRRLGLMSPVQSGLDFLRTTDGSLASQVVKAAVGSMAMGISIYLTPEDRAVFGKKGTVSSSRLQRDTLEYARCEGAMTQEFHPPILLDNNEQRRHAIMRIFVLLSLDKASNLTTADAIGGCFVARPELIVHGASNAVSGAILVE